MREMSIIVMGIALATSAAACGGGDGRIFGAEDLASIVFGPAEAPPGLKFEPAASGTELELYAEGKEERDMITSLGVAATNIALFTTPGLLEGKPQGPPRVFASFALRFREPDGARDMLDFYDNDFLARHFVGGKKIDRQDLGEESLAWQFRRSGRPELPLPGYFVAWREGNGLFGIAFLGGTEASDRDQVERLAREMAARIG
jgi:hypothetical protein